MLQPARPDSCDPPLDRRVLGFPVASADNIGDGDNAN
jgi:hypothetical protein